MTQRRSEVIAHHFRSLLDSFSLTAKEDAEARARIAAIQVCLKATFVGREARVMGSFARGTFVRGQSDVDLFAPFTRDEARHGGRYVNSRTLLKRVRDALQRQYSRSIVERDGPAITLQFARGGVQCYDVVPAVFEEMRDSHPVYLIPDGTGGWMPTSPSRHAKILTEASDRSGRKLLGVVRLVKWWTGLRSKPTHLNSFHMEMVLAGAGLGLGVASYSELMAAAFRLLASRKARALKDPAGLSHLIPAADTEAKRNSTSERLRSAANDAEDAWAFESQGQEVRAMQRWNRVFNGFFG